MDLFCHVDDFFKVFIPQWQKLQLENGERKRNRQSRMSSSEIMTIIIAFHMSHQRDFKNFYLGVIRRYYNYLKPEKPSLNITSTEKLFDGDGLKRSEVMLIQ